MTKLVAGGAFLIVLLPEAVAAAGEGFINLDWSLLIQAVNFGLLLLLLWRFFYRPFLATLDERSRALKQSLAEAQAAQAEALRQREEHRRQLQAAYAEAQSIRESALREAGEAQQRLLEAARAEADRLVEAARTQIEQDVRRARQELRQEVGGLAVSVAERLIRRSLGEGDHRRIVGEAIAELERRP